MRKTEHLFQSIIHQKDQHEGLVSWLVTIQFSDQVKIRFISQLISGISNVLQKLLKCFSGTTISTSFSVLLPCNLPVMLVL